VFHWCVSLVTQGGEEERKVNLLLHPLNLQLVKLQALETTKNPICDFILKYFYPITTLNRRRQNLARTGAKLLAGDRKERRQDTALRHVGSLTGKWHSNNGPNCPTPHMLWNGQKSEK
jgi:hypothetical protein